MVDIKSNSNPLFLREENLREAIELLFFAYRDFTGEPDRILDKIGFGRAHHRVIYFVGQNSRITVGELLEILQITKQSLARVLKTLIDQGFIEQAHGTDDKRKRHLLLTSKGQELEGELLASQFALLSTAFEQAGQEAVEGFRVVLEKISGRKPNDNSG